MRTAGIPALPAHLRRAQGKLRESDDDAVKMLALRLDALCRAFLDSVIGDG